MTKFYVSTILTSQVIDSQIHVIRKAIRPLFAARSSHKYKIDSMSCN